MATFHVTAYSRGRETCRVAGKGCHPERRSTLVILEDGRGLDVRSTVPSRFKSTGFKAAGTGRAADLRSFQGMRRFMGFLAYLQDQADAPVGFDKVRVEAKNPKTHKADATLKVLVLDKKTVKVAIRSIQVRDGQQLVSLGNSADPKTLLSEMNAIWNPQANVFFELGRTDAATIDGLSPQADTIEMQKLPKGFLDERDSGSALTFFLVKKVTNGGKADRGATNAKEAIALIAESRSDSTMAHEAGHFLGALTAKGKYDSEYGHPEKSQDMLMHADHLGKKSLIPR
jgi:hypothetical protein